MRQSSEEPALAPLQRFAEVCDALHGQAATGSWGGAEAAAGYSADTSRTLTIVDDGSRSVMQVGNRVITASEAGNVPPSIQEPDIHTVPLEDLTLGFADGQLTGYYQDGQAHTT